MTVLFLVLPAVGCFAAALVCMVVSVGGWLQYGDWLHPGWTNASVFGVDHAWFAEMKGVQQIITDVMPMNAGWGFLTLGIVGTLLAMLLENRS